MIRWIEALNARDLDRILACVAPDIEFHPLKLSASRPAYVGHDGIRQWFDEVQNRRHEIRELSLEGLADRRVLAVGVIVLDGQNRPTDFAAIYRVADGLIGGGHHYLSDRAMLSRLGVLPWPALIGREDGGAGSTCPSSADGGFAGCLAVLIRS